MSNTWTNAYAVSAFEMTRLAASGSFFFPTGAGGAVTPSSGLTVAVAAITGGQAVINGTSVATGYAGGTVVLDAASSTGNRRDIIYYDTSGSVGKVTGTPVTPVTYYVSTSSGGVVTTALPAVVGPVPPALSSSQIAIAEVYVAINDTTIDAGEIVDRRQDPMGGSKKTASTGNYFLIPTGPALGTSLASSASADTYGSWVQMVDATSAALFIVGYVLNDYSHNSAMKYVQLDIGVGAAAAEVSVGEFYTGSVVEGGSDKGLPQAVPIYPIPVAASTRIAARIADAAAAAYTAKLTLLCINQSDLASF